MGRAFAAAGVLVLACVMGVAAPAGSGASATAATAKSKCKHRHPHHRKRCRKKIASESPSAGGGGAAPGGSTDPSSPPGRLLATEREVSPTQLQLQLSRPSLSAGTAIVEQYNAGSDPHNLILEQAGMVAFSFGTLDPGGDARQTVTLKRGTYTLYCSLLDHRSQGMQATLTVN
jgi:plastocyanin